MTAEEKPKRGMLSRLFGRGEDAKSGRSEEPGPEKKDDSQAGAAQESATSGAVNTSAAEAETASAQSDEVVAPVPPPMPEPPTAEPVTPLPVAPPKPDSSSSPAEVASTNPLPTSAEPADSAPTSLAPATPEPEPQPGAEAAPAPGRGWFARLRSGLAKSSSKLTTGITEVFTKRRLDGAMLDDLEDLLIQSDLGVEPAMEITEALRASRYDKDISPEEVRAFLAGEVEKRLEPVATPLDIPDAPKPFVILVVGVNGSGKTTTIGKLAARFRTEGKSVMLAAGDTFRAAAIDQLRIWGERVGAPVVARDVGADAAGLAFDAQERAAREGIDVLLIDTAGRLQNKADLMAELSKVVRVLGKKMPGAPHAVLLVLDATVGQNAISQAQTFREIAGVTGLVMTKLDGTARGGILVALASKFGLPVHAIGVGEQVEDLQAFSARDFARAIAGVEEAA